jgi:hypothetical protein
MIHLRDHLHELAETAARQGRTAGPMAAVRRGRQRRRRLAGTAALLAVVLVAGAVGADHLGRGGRYQAPASPATRPRFPAKLATYAATVADGSAEAAVLRLVTDRSEGLGACKGGRPEDVRIVAVGPLPSRQGVWMIAARPPLPTERRLCWMFAFGNQRDVSSPVAYAGEPPLLTPLLAMGSGDPSKLVVDGYVTKQAARVRLILAGGKPPLDLEPLQSGSDFPVNFFVAVVPWRGSKEKLPVERLIALDGSGRAIASCWLGGGHPSCGRQR